MPCSVRLTDGLGLVRAVCFAVMKIEIKQADWRHKDCKKPAEKDSEPLHEQHDNCVQEEHVAAHDEAYDALIYKAGVRIQERVDHYQGDEAKRSRIRALERHEQDECRDDRAKEELADVVLRSETSEGLGNDGMHGNS